MPGIPTIRRELNWVHIAQRFPVRIDIDYPQPANAFRVGASAVTIILGHCQRLARTVAVLTRAGVSEHRSDRVTTSTGRTSRSGSIRAVVRLEYSSRRGTSL
jgi:hypothetical protein